MSKTIVFRSDRTPQPGRVHVGFETDNMVERLAFVLPQLDAQQTAMLMLGGTYVNMVQLSEGGGVYYVDMTAELIGKAGEAEGYVVVNTPDGRVWNSAPFVLITGDLPDIDSELQEHFPDAIQQMRQEIAEHNAEMAEQAETAHAAVNAAEAAAKRSETAAESFVEQDPTVPEWAKQPSKPVYSSEEVGAPSKQELNVLAAKVDNKQPKGDYALKSEIPNVTGYATEAWVGTQLAGYQPKGDYQPAGDYALKSELPSVPTQLSELAQDATHRLTTDAEKAAWNAKVRTVNGAAPDANGNVQIEAGGGVTSWNDLEDRPVVMQGDQEKIALSHLYQPDWNQNDESAADFVKNRTHYSEEGEVVLIPETEYTGADSGGIYMANISAFEITESIIVVFDGLRYECEMWQNNDMYCYGNASLMGGEDTGEPFALAIIPSVYVGMLGMLDAKTHTVEVIAKKTIYHKIPTEYLDAQRVFYFNEGSYIYTDAACTVKATREEMANACKDHTVYLQYVMGGLVLVQYYPALLNFAEEYGVAVCATAVDGDGNPKWKAYYTAEYTPTT